jgi:metallophosphoesterase superfamily enzyme
MPSKFKKFCTGFDAHIGHEIKKSRGKSTKVVTHDKHILRLHLDFVKDFKPDVYIAGGDTFNMGFISRHNNGFPRLVEGLKATDEYELADSLFFTPLEKLLKSKTKIILPGNHEAWIEHFIDKNQQFEGMIEPESYLKLGKRGWEVVDYGGTYKLGKLYVTHGDAVRGAAKHRAASMLGKYKKNILSGHVHTHQVYLETAIADEQPHMSIVSPMLGALKPHYLNGNPTNWVNGWTYGYILPNGNFYCYTAIVIEGKVVVEGKVYG